MSSGPALSPSRSKLQLNTQGKTSDGALAARRRLLFGALAAVVLLDVAAALVVRRQLEETTRARVRSVLESMLSSEVEAVEQWFTVRKGRLGTLVSAAEFRQRALSALANPNDPQALDAMRGEGERISLGGQRVNWVLATADGRVLLDEARLGAQLPAPLMAWLQGERRQQPSIRVPFELEPGRSSGFGIAPLVEAGEALGYLVVTIDPAEFARGPFASRRVMETGELYAFDPQGLLLSESRFPEVLRKAGLLDANATSTARAFELRDPGIDLTTGERSAKARGELPLTRAVLDAISGRAGSDFDGYRDYRGVRVFGAWRWDAARQFGLVVELDEEEALMPVTLVRPMLTGLFVALGLVVAGMAWLFIRFRASEARAARLLEEANRLGQYELVRKLGEGGMGVVYEARHALLHRPAAIKVMQAGALSEVQLTRFDREAQVTASLAHPNTVSIYDFGRTSDGSYYYVMELLAGADLEDLVHRTGPLPEARVVHVLRQLCGSLAEAHLHGLVHRDIKPANVFLTSRAGVHDVVKVLDFGLVRVTRGQAAGLTQSQLIMGTPLYMAPETFEGADRATPASDLYAVGAVAYWLVCGKPVFDDKRSLPDLMMDHRARSPVPVAQVLGHAIDPALQAFIDACLQKDPAARPRSTWSALELLDGFAQPAWRDQDARAWWETKGAAHAGARVAADDEGTADTLEPQAVAPRKDVATKPHGA